MNIDGAEIAKQELARARKALRAAKTLVDVELYEDAVSRAYYAVLHGARAALAAEGVFPSSHPGVARMFGLHLVKTGVIEREYATILTAESEDREIGDYDVTVMIEESRARQRVVEAERFLIRVAKHVGN